ncbi:MAG: hypothetical protein LUG60_07050 [Erysipelotrichaceae bacterium]|nr:hypothetical protein [Erysipelotrichaceae bacterium]
MLNHSISLMNTYLKTLNCKKINYFHEKDFMQLTVPSPYFHGYASSCIQYQTIIYKNNLFRIGIKCIANIKLDKIAIISFYSKEVNYNNPKDIVECVQQLLINFTYYINENLYLELSKTTIIKTFYNQTLQKLQRKHQQLCINKPLYIDDIKKVDSSLTGNLPYSIFMIIYIYEEKIINISMMFDLQHQL